MIRWDVVRIFFFFNDTATTEIYTLSLHDALPISPARRGRHRERRRAARARLGRACRSLDRGGPDDRDEAATEARRPARRDRKSTRLNSSHANISYAVFCLKKKKLSVPPPSPSSSP